MISNATDVLVIGGGPAGSTFGTLASARGWHVTVLEKDEHPRFHIGESLLPMNLPLFEKLRVLNKIEEIGVPKLGADFTVANSGEEHTTIYFADALGQSPDHAFEVLRSEFDRLLFERCGEAGADTHEKTKVTRVDALSNGSHRVTAVDPDGREIDWEARFVVDASGRDAFMSTSRGWKQRNAKHASAAVFAHFRDVERRPGQDNGNISLYWFSHGWIWLIPLRDNIMSVGAVCHPDHLRTRRGTLEEFLIETLTAVAEIRDRMRNASLVTAVQATGNYSYLSTRMHGPGYLMIGDAFAFIDPVFSSGVYLAMSSAASAVDVTDAWFSGSAQRFRRECRRHEKMMRRGMAAFSWFIYRFTTPAMRYLMSNPRNALRVYESVVAILAGDVFRNTEVRRRLLIFKIIYAIASLRSWRDELAASRRRRAAALQLREKVD
jgi:flavin-dependent dehydrogenase